MVVNGDRLKTLYPILGMKVVKEVAHGTSYGLSEAGYDIRIKQAVIFSRENASYQMGVAIGESVHECRSLTVGRFTLASAIEEFQMPYNLVGIVHDKSTWARRGLSVFNTVIEPGWNGFLTLELVYHGNEELIIPAGSGIAQVIFHELTDTAAYKGKYQEQADMPVAAIASK